MGSPALSVAAGESFAGILVRFSLESYSPPTFLVIGDLPELLLLLFFEAEKAD